MAKLPTPFTEVACPVCGRKIDCRAGKAPLIGHIGGEHPTASARQLVRALFHELHLSMPENIDEINNKELDELLANLCLYKATTLGLKQLRRKIRRR